MSRQTEDANASKERSFPYVLVCSIAGTIISLGSVWIITPLSYPPVLGG